MKFKCKNNLKKNSCQVSASDELTSMLHVKQMFKMIQKLLQMQNQVFSSDISDNPPKLRNTSSDRQKVHLGFFALWALQFNYHN